MKNFSFTTSKTIINEIGSLQRIGEVCLSQGITKPLIVTDAGIKQLGLLARLEQQLSAAGLPFYAFTEVIADPPEAIVNQALAYAKAEAVDGIIGFGGGSSMDTAKLVALMARSGEALADIYGVEQAKGKRLPLILIPTTAGTGSEVTAVAIVTTGETTKMGVVASQLYPDVALLDAELTVDLPPSITAMTGVDAMVHAVEAYTSIHKKNPYTDMLAREALRLLSSHIVTATHDGNNIEARQAMLLGACLAGQAFANAPVAAVHALAYPLGGHYHIPHGLSNSLMLPHVLRFNAPAAQFWYAELAEIVIPLSELAVSVSARCVQLEQYFIELIATLGLPATLSELNVPAADLSLLAADAMLQQRLLINNPRELLVSDALALYQAAF
ncbi:iron-containing alcohol dehydrogenase [Oceanicoccus sp. KOV_DT_Chl]|uniref:iron-containing alcohol dehydrogenase n=1 Tax=Oceanicoccus sp. KOV_DT_Chl TaxID=1904639 RepID=UPI000C7A257E|nr:iron-containing alcohol dehydrogenase [Oceanicoccus sp. KOV_DT_Chl]